MRAREQVNRHLTGGLPHEVAASHPHEVRALSGASLSLGALALGAVAMGAIAIGAMAIGRLAIGRARIRRLEIDELVVRRLRVIEQLQGPPKPDAES